MKVLIVDDEKNIRLSLAEYLSSQGFSVDAAAGALPALEKLAQGDVDVLLTDYRMPGMDGYALAKEALERDPRLVVIVMTAYGSISDAVESIKRGIHDYIPKPIQVDDLLAKLSAIQSKRSAAARSPAAPAPAALSEAGRSIDRFVERAAASPNTVLLTGETGTGKTEVARRIHATGPRAAKPFVYVNCAAISPTLVESEIFGHVKGAFTGADRARPGKIVQAQGGTLFLDEIGSTSLEFQSKLLSVLQDRRFEPVGGDSPLTADVRFIAATNADLEAAIAQRAFRADLFYRLKVLSFKMPPLRERRADIPLLVGQILAESGEGRAPDVAAAAMQRLERHAWPGNIRELKNILLAALDVAEGAIAAGDLFFDADEADPAAAPGATLDEKMSVTEKEAILRALRECGGSASDTAARLGIHERSLRRKLKQYGIERKDFVRKPAD